MKLVGGVPGTFSKQGYLRAAKEKRERERERERDVYTCTNIGIYVHILWRFTGDNPVPGLMNPLPLIGIMIGIKIQMEY